jgi:hypothetical protein
MCGNPAKLLVLRTHQFKEARSLFHSLEEDIGYLNSNGILARDISEPGLF